MEKCESCQKSEMTFEKVNAQPDSNEEGYWYAVKSALNGGTFSGQNNV